MLINKNGIYLVHKNVPYIVPYCCAIRNMNYTLTYLKNGRNQKEKAHP